ncbi:serine/threonine-protein kinase [Nonomuraea sp. NPDC050556]|uniref:serine/threonine-protein kinase n=1 Tax=Nonomuraea sp. NPDC050556 TaxID=3364369 RepID=UPI0037B7AD77
MVTPLTPDDPDRLGEFTLAGRLGEGGQGVVYLAHGRSGEAVAVKLLTHSDPETRARLARELDALESVASFCTARVLTASIDGARPWVVSEFVDGPSLLERVRDRGPLRGGDLERLFVYTATALAAIHAAGVVHRDFKPANVLLGPDGPRVVDFGIARAEGASTMTSGLIGTPTYLAPEQIHGSPATAASDVFAWATTMVFAATGVTAFGADTVPAVLQKVLYSEPDLSALPPRLQGLIASALAKDPARRPTGQDLMVALVNPNRPQPYAPGPTAPGVSQHTTGPVKRGSSRAPLIAAAAVVVALAAAGGVLWFNRAPASHGSTTATSDALPTPTTGPSTASPETSETSVQQAAPLKIPAAFAGKWAGHTTTTNPMDANGSDNWVELKAGRSEAAWREYDSEVDCKGTITLTKVEKDKLTFSLGANQGGCIPGTIWLTLDGDTLAYLWRDVPGNDLVQQTGDLRRS